MDYIIDHINYFGVTHHNTPLSEREVFSLTEDEIKLAYSMALTSGLNEVFILSTCARTEFYSYGSSDQLIDFIKKLYHSLHRKCDFFIIGFIIFLLLFVNFISGCSLPKQDEERNLYSLKNFSLIQLEKRGKKLFKLNSSDATVDPLTNNINAKNVTIIFYNKNLLFNKISSKNCILDKENNKLYLYDQVLLDNDSNSQSYIRSNLLNWDMNNSNVLLKGNVFVKYYLTELKSNSATYNRKKDMVIFNEKTSYKIYKNDNVNNQSIVSLMADKANIDNKKKAIIFDSVKNQVESIINLDLF